MIIIVTYHFYAHFAENNIAGFRVIFSDGKWGLIGVAMFFMISGAALMFNYQEGIEIKTYAKKRFRGIYPMFWIAYISLYLILFYEAKGNITNLSPFRLIFSVFAMDGYLGCFTPTIYLIGEWFLGCIILIYAIFPILRWLVNKYPKITIIAASMLNLVILLFHRNGIMLINQNLFVSLYSFLLGMYIIRINRFRVWHAAFGGFVAIVFYVLPASNFNLQTLYANVAAYGLFVLLAFLGQRVNNEMVQKIFTIVSKYSYAVFLVHHYLIMRTLRTFSDRDMGIVGTALLYFCVWRRTRPYPPDIG